MANKQVSLDFNKMLQDVNMFFQNVLTYFKGLTTDMIIAWSVLAVGIVALIIALLL
ncbi:MAG: hypothetical protein ACP5NW_03080 [Candidatus Woesearchaeota archaeon]